MDFVSLFWGWMWLAAHRLGHGGWAENEKVNERAAELGVREGFHSYPEYET